MVALAIGSTLATVVVAWNLALIVSSIFIEGAVFEFIFQPLVYVLLAGLAKALFIWFQELLGARAASAVILELRLKLFVGVQKLGSQWLDQRSIAEVSTLSTSGLSALEPYFAKYLPQLVYTAIVTPIFIALIWSQDFASGITVLATIPLIPLFMVLIGWATRSVQQIQLDSLVALSQHFLEVLRGLTTLRVFGRAKAQVQTIEQVSEEYRVRTMKVLRVSFLSGFALELAASLSVALIAVSIGLRLVDGQIALFTGLFILILAPEAYLPLRQVGVQFHAASEGVTASVAVLDILDEAEAFIAPTVEPITKQYVIGALNVLVGPSGIGKSTKMRQLAKQQNVAWMPQSLGLVSGTVAENIHGPVSKIDEKAFQSATQMAALDDLQTDQQVGESASQVSGGQAQRIAIARTFYAALAERSRWLLLDEPISALDASRAQHVISSLKVFAEQGTTVVAITHQRQLIDAAQNVIEVQGAN